MSHKKEEEGEEKFKEEEVREMDWEELVKLNDEHELKVDIKAIKEKTQIKERRLKALRKAVIEALNEKGLLAGDEDDDEEDEDGDEHDHEGGDEHDHEGGDEHDHEGAREKFARVGSGVKHLIPLLAVLLGIGVLWYIGAFDKVGLVVDYAGQKAEAEAVAATSTMIPACNNEGGQTHSLRFPDASVVAGGLRASLDLKWDTPIGEPFENRQYVVSLVNGVNADFHGEKTQVFLVVVGAEAGFVPTKYFPQAGIESQCGLQPTFADALKRIAPKKDTAGTLASTSDKDWQMLGVAAVIGLVVCIVWEAVALRNWWMALAALIATILTITGTNPKDPDDWRVLVPFLSGLAISLFGGNQALKALFGRIVERVSDEDVPEELEEAVEESGGGFFSKLVGAFDWSIAMWFNGMVLSAGLLGMQGPLHVLAGNTAATLIHGGLVLLFFALETWRHGKVIDWVVFFVAIGGGLVAFNSLVTMNPGPDRNVILLLVTVGVFGGISLTSSSIVSFVELDRPATAVAAYFIAFQVGNLLIHLVR